MDRAATQHAVNTPTAANRTYTVQCGRCRAVIVYDNHSDWPTVSLRVNEHLGTCPVKLNFHGPGPSRPPSEICDTQNAPSHSSIESMGADDSKHDNQPSAGRRKQKKSEVRRKRELEYDEYTYSKDKLDKPVTIRDGIYNPQADSMLRVANSVEDNISRQTELSDDEDLEEDIPFSTLNERFYNECRQMGDGPWAYRYSTTKEIKERTMNTVYFDIAS